jgi:hypothetical protein
MMKSKLITVTEAVRCEMTHLHVSQFAEWISGKRVLAPVAPVPLLVALMDAFVQKIVTSA